MQPKRPRDRTEPNDRAEPGQWLRNEGGESAGGVGGVDCLGRPRCDQKGAGNQVEADQFHAGPEVGHEGGSRIDGQCDRADRQFADEVVQPGNQPGPSGVAPEDGIEGERPACLGEEPLCPRLAAETAAEDVGAEVGGGQGPGHPLPGEKTPAHAFGAVLEQHGKDVVDAHEVDGATAEVRDLLGEREGGEMGHWVRHALTHRRPHEDPAFEPAGQCRLDAVRLERGQPQPALVVGSPTGSPSGPRRTDGSVHIGERGG